MARLLVQACTAEGGADIVFNVLVGVSVSRVDNGAPVTGLKHENFRVASITFGSVSGFHGRRTRVDVGTGRRGTFRLLRAQHLARWRAEVLPRNPLRVGNPGPDLHRHATSCRRSRPDDRRADQLGHLGTAREDRHKASVCWPKVQNGSDLQ
jgi:hypothetical protein